MQAATAMAARHSAPDLPVLGWSTDSRTLTAGDLFFALRGPTHDGHDHVAAALERGAVAAVVDKAPRGLDGAPLLMVRDTRKALEDTAAWARRHWGGDVVGITGSAGKTTTKEAVATMLSTRLRVGRNQGNLNNHIGLPLSILRLPEDTEVAVLEMGMNHAGEIAELSRIAGPRIGVVTNAGYAHVENFDGPEGVAAAKRELIESLDENGTAVLNADDPRVRLFAGGLPCRRVLYGLSPDADVRAEDVEYSGQGVKFRVGGTPISSSMQGRHGVQNLLAGIAVAGLYGISPQDLGPAIQSIAPGEMRGKRILHDGIQHIDDCYNSNPDAACAMLDLLADTPARRRIAVLGEMRELGQWSGRLHRGLGEHAARTGTDVLVGIRGAAKHVVEAAVEAGLPAGAACFFDDSRDAGEFVRSIAREGDVILWKGSRGTRVELALERMLG